MNQFSGHLNNPADPLLKGQSSEVQLFAQIVKQCGGRPSDQVIGVAVNLLVNAVRQAYPRKQDAEAKMSELLGQAMYILGEHYNGAGKRKSIFPHTQVVDLSNTPPLKLVR